MKNRGLTLLELVLALVITGVVILGGSSLYLSTVGTSLIAQTDTRMQNEIDFIFRDAEVYLRGGIVGGTLTTQPVDTGFTKVHSLSSPYFYRGAGGLWLGIVAGEGADAVEVWYGYKFASGNTPAKVVRCVYTVGADKPVWTETVLSSSGMLMPYADSVDADGNGVIDDAEKKTRDLCLQDAKSKTNCEDKGIYPVFKISGDKKLVYISLKASSMVLGGKKPASTPGSTRAISLHSSAG